MGKQIKTENIKLLEMTFSVTLCEIQRKKPTGMLIGRFKTCFKQ